MHHAVEPHFGLAFSKILCQGKLTIYTNAHPAEIDFNTRDGCQYLTSGILN
jgi:hypothetical protein